MARKRDTVHATSEDIVAMLARGEDETDWVRVNAKTEKDLAADTASDPAWAGIDDGWVKSAGARTVCSNGRRKTSGKLRCASTPTCSTSSRPAGGVGKVV